MNSDIKRPGILLRLWPWLAAALSGVLLACCFPPVAAGGLGFLALTPLLCAVWLHRPKRRPGLFRFLAGYLCGIIFFTSTFYWIGELAPLYGMPGLWLLPFALSWYLGLYVAVWAWFAGWLVGGHFEVKPPDPMEPFSRPPLLSSFRNMGIAFALAAAWTGLEWTRGWVFTGFSWNGLGVSLYLEKPLIQIVEFTGVGGLSFLLVVANVIAVITILRLRAEIGRVRLRPHFDFAITVALFVGVFAYGVREIRIKLKENATQPILRVAAIQPHVPQPLKFGRDPDGDDALGKTRHLTAVRHMIAAFSQPDLVVWPEAAVLGGMFGSQDNFDYVMDLASMSPALLLGSDDSNRFGVKGDDHNSAVLVQHGDKEAQIYDKIHLVPFGEYVPLRPLFMWLPDDILNGDFLHGKESKVFTLRKPEIKLGPLVCFEDTDGDLSRRPVKMGAHVLVNITNDGWFGLSAGALQHMHNAVFLAVQNRRPLVRSTNNAYTGFVDTLGQMHEWSEPFKPYPPDGMKSNEAIHEVRYAPTPSFTFYTLYGEIFSQTCAAAAILILAIRIALLRRRAATQS